MILIEFQDSTDIWRDWTRVGTFRTVNDAIYRTIAHFEGGMETPDSFVTMSLFNSDTQTYQKCDLSKERFYFLEIGKDIFEISVHFPSQLLRDYNYKFRLKEHNAIIECDLRYKVEVQPKSASFHRTAWNFINLNHVLCNLQN